MSKPTIEARLERLGLRHHRTLRSDASGRHAITRATGDVLLGTMTAHEAVAFIEHIEAVLLDVRREALLNAEDAGMGYERLDETDDILRRAIEKVAGFMPPPYYDDDADDGQPSDLQEHADFAQDGEFENMSAGDML